MRSSPATAARKRLAGGIANAILLGASLTIALAGAEAALRLAGHAPFTASEDLTGVLQTWNQLDRDVGWIYRPNSVTTFAGAMTIWPDATRRTRNELHSDAPSHGVLIGCSYAQSYGLDDDTSLGWLLQDQFPQLDFRNRATGGYGSYQSLLVLRRHFAEAQKPTALVIYGMGSFHGVRDRASRAWMPSLRPRGHLSAFIPPRADVDRRGELVEYPGQYVAAWRIAEVSAVANLVQKTVNSLLATADDPRKDFRTQLAIVRAMRDLAASHGAKFLAAMIYVPDEWEFREQAFAELQRHGIDHVDCTPPDIRREHPDAYWTKRHAACIGPAAARLLQ